jgi:hypothetical protein
VSAIDVTTELEAITQARETFAARRIPTEAERQAMRRANDALRRGLS